MNWYTIENIDEIDTPALVVFTERVRENITTMINMVNGNTDRLRPHVKTHKSVEATKLMMEAGIYKFKCATIAEAEMLANTNAKDVLLAYQPTVPKLQRFMRLIQQFPATNFSCLVDNISSAQQIADAAEKQLITIPVFIDINVGMNRTGIAPGEQALALCRFITSNQSLNLAGLHVYDGHIRTVDFATRKAESDAAFTTVENMITQLRSEAITIPTIIAGGSPTFSVHAQRNNVECSPGTYIYWDKGYSAYAEQQFKPAALVLTRVVSFPAENKICLDLGHKSIASENPLDKRVFFPQLPGATFIGHSEEHLVIEANQQHTLQVGDVLYGIPYHICPTVALYERAITIEDHKVTGEWQTIARNRKLTV